MTSGKPPRARLRVGIGNGIRGYYAMLYDADTGEPWETGSASFSEARPAYDEARAWAQAEDIPYDLPPVPAPAARLRPYAGIGSRETPEEMLTLMREIAGLLAAAGWLLRSGAAPGADAAFESGAPATAREIFLPWLGFQNSTSTLAIERMPVLSQAMDIASQYHRGWGRLGRPVRLLMARNVCQVLGPDLKDPSRFVLCWAPYPKCDHQGRVMDVGGGTGLAVRLAYAHGIPVFHLGLPAHRQRIDSFLKAA